MDGLSVSDANLVIHLHPSQSKDVSKAILRQLSSLLFTFSETFDGVILAYGVNASDTCARILPQVHPYFTVRLKAKLLVFSPKKGMLLEGKVEKLTPTSIHVIVLGFSSAIITEEDIRDEFQYKTKHGDGLYLSRCNRRHKIKNGTTIRFEVKSMDKDMLHISGSLILPHTGNVKWLEIYFENPIADRLIVCGREGGVVREKDECDTKLSEKQMKKEIKREPELWEEEKDPREASGYGGKKSKKQRIS